MADADAVGGRGFGAVELPFAVKRGKQVRMVGNALRTRQEQHSARIEGVVKAGDEPLLLFAFQIDQQVAATQQVELGEGRILDHAVHGKHHFLADELLHLETAAFIRFLDEELAQALRRHILGDIGRVVAGARRGDGVVVEVGGENLEVPLLRVGVRAFVEQFLQHHGDRIGFFTAGATGHPDAKHTAGRLGGQQGWQDADFQRNEGLGIAEEVGDVDQQFLEQRLDFSGVVLEKARIDGQIVNGVLRHAPLDATADGAFLVEREIVAGGAAQLQQDLVDAAEGFFRLGAR